MLRARILTGWCINAPHRSIWHVVELHFGWSHAVAVALLQTLPPTHLLQALLKPVSDILGSHFMPSL